MATRKHQLIRVSNVYFVGGIVTGAGGLTLAGGELYALLDATRGDTISEHVWGFPWALMVAVVLLCLALAGFFLWLSVHFYTRWEKRVPDSDPDVQLLRTVAGKLRDKLGPEFVDHGEAK